MVAQPSVPTTGVLIPLSAITASSAAAVFERVTEAPLLSGVPLMVGSYLNLIAKSPVVKRRSRHGRANVCVCMKAKVLIS